MYSVREAAQALGLEASYVRRLLMNGEIEGKKLGHDWVVLSLVYKRKRRPRSSNGGDNGHDQDGASQGTQCE